MKGFVADGFYVRREVPWSRRIRCLIRVQLFAPRTKGCRDCCICGVVFILNSEGVHLAFFFFYCAAVEAFLWNSCNVMRSWLYEHIRRVNLGR